MTGFHYYDPFATKHFEYLLVVGFLALLVLFWRFMQRTCRQWLPIACIPMPSFARWSELPQGLHYHLVKGEVAEINKGVFENRELIS